MFGLGELSWVPRAASVPTLREPEYWKEITKHTRHGLGVIPGRADYRHPQPHGSSPRDKLLASTVRRHQRGRKSHDLYSTCSARGSVRPKKTRERVTYHSPMRGFSYVDKGADSNQGFPKTPGRKTWAVDWALKIISLRLIGC
jgi:hypothetical protein